MKRPTPKKTTKARPWTKEDVQALKTMVREKTKTTVIARKLKRTPSATRQKAGALGVKLTRSNAAEEKGIRLVADHYPARPGSGLRSIRPVWIAILSVTQLVYAGWRLRRAGTGAEIHYWTVCGTISAGHTDRRRNSRPVQGINTK